MGAMATPAAGSSLVVPDDYPSPAAALVAGAQSGVDTVLVRSGTYTEVVLSDLPGGNTMAGAVLYPGVYLLSHPGNLARPVIDVGPPAAGEERVAIATASDGAVTVDGFELPPGPSRSIDADTSQLTVLNSACGAGIRIRNCPSALINGNEIGAAAGDAVFAQDSGLTLSNNMISGSAGDAITWVSMAGEMVAEDNTIRANRGFGLVLSGTGVSVDIRGNLIMDNLESGVFLTLTSSTAIVEGNTIWNNGDVGVRTTAGAAITIARNIIGMNQIGVTCESGLTFTCNDVWQNTVSGYDGPCGDHTTDFALDPEFCCTDGTCFTLQADSPCAEGNSGGCGQVGARPVACGAQAIEDATWGQIKSRFQR
jgi:hypothetical protein